MTSTLETRIDDRTGVPIPCRVTTWPDGSRGEETIWGAATGLHIHLVTNRRRLAVPGDMSSGSVPA